MIRSGFAEHVVRFGALGHVGRFVAADATRYARGRRVILRTSRGLELGEVLSAPEPVAAVAPNDDATDALERQADGQVLRAVTVADELLQARLLKNRVAALDACQSRLDAEGISTVLLDVEHLFDGQSLVFYFLGDVDPRVEALTTELASAYDAQAQYSAFVDAATTGCGPGCGTDEAAGCGSCSTHCAVSAMCSSRSH
ncbi:MAG: hypothetical protein JSS27_16535 [Planctomycetes bacterium]|nr:hypothetical protein [Planctomycetota bacterium]